MVQIHLRPNLSAIPTVDKDRRLVRGYCRIASRSGKTRQPRQTLVARGDILALVCIGAGDDDRVDFSFTHLCAKGGQTTGAVLGGRGVVKILEHADLPYG